MKLLLSYMAGIANDSERPLMAWFVPIAIASEEGLSTAQLAESDPTHWDNIPRRRSAAMLAALRLPAEA
jgi:hypothetical protein